MSVCRRGQPSSSYLCKRTVPRLPKDKSEAMTYEACSKVWAPTGLSYFTLTMAAILLVVIVGGNLLVCLAVFLDPHRNLRSPFMFILVNLAVTDLIVGAVTMPTAIVTHSLEVAKSRKKYHAMIIHMTYFISCTASILNLMVLSIDRYIAVKWPMKYRGLLNYKVCVAVSLTIWLLAIGISMIYLAIGYTDFLFIYAHAALIVAVIIAIITYRMSRYLRRNFKKRLAIMQDTMPKGRGEDAGPLMSKSARKAERRVTRAFLFILIMFIGCYTPAVMMMYVLKFCSECSCVSRHVLDDLSFLFVVSNSAVNPFVCTIRLKPFRYALRTILRIRSEEKSPLSSEETTSPGSRRKQGLSENGV